jgi:hypothetical protein
MIPIYGKNMCLIGPPYGKLYQKTIFPFTLKAPECHRAAKSQIARQKSIFKVTDFLKTNDKNEI